MKALPRYHLVLGTASLMLAAGVVYGCSDFLETAGTPQGTLDQGTLASKQGVEGTLIAAYRMLDCTSSVGSWGCAGSNWVFGSVPSDDAYKGTEASDQPEINDIEGYHWATQGADEYLNAKWQTVYEGVVRANAALRLLKKVRDEKPGEISDADADRIRGEALFLRAHYHFEAWRMWGNIPYYTEDDTDFRKSNVGVDVVAALLKDLDEAINLNLLPTTQGDVGRATRWTAKAYKGRVQVYAGDYAGALTTLGEVRTSGPYKLEASFDRVWTGFQEYSNGPETIFAFQASVNDGDPSGWNSNWGERLNFPHSGSHFGCCGFHQPSQNLVNFFRVDPATGLPLALTDPNWNANDANFTAGNLTIPVDPRLDWTVGRDGVPYKEWGPHASGWIRSPTYGGPYSPKKHVHEKASGAESSVGWVPTQTNSVNLHLFRYADLLLLLAEAEVEAGNPENARTIVNDIRTRAGVRAQGPGNDRNDMAVAINDPRITWATYRIGLYPGPWAKDDATRTKVRYERRLELAMEGQRFFDLRRLGIADAVLNPYVAVEKNRRSHLTGAEAVTARHRWYPLPALQIELSKVGGEERLKQNNGW